MPVLMRAFTYLCQQSYTVPAAFLVPFLCKRQGHRNKPALLLHHYSHVQNRRCYNDARKILRTPQGTLSLFHSLRSYSTSVRCAAVSSLIMKSSMRYDPIRFWSLNLLLTGAYYHILASVYYAYDISSRNVRSHRLNALVTRSWEFL
jgi:hypothetical protein